MSTIGRKSDAETPATDKLQSVHQWLGGTGFSLEYRAADIFRRAGFAAWHSHYVENSTEGAVNALELDVLVASEGSNRFEIIVECKHVGVERHPWVLFRDVTHACPGDGVGRGGGTASLLSIEEFRSSTAAALPELFADEDNVASALRVAGKSNGSETSFKAVQGLVGKTLGRLRQIEVTEAVLIWPVLVLSDELVQATWDGRQFQLEEVTHGILAWRGHQLWPAEHASVIVAAESALPVIAASLHEMATRWKLMTDSEALRARAAEAHRRNLSEERQRLETKQQLGNLFVRKPVR